MLNWRGRLVLAAVVVLALGAGYELWFRDSSLVAIDEVEVVGVEGPEREQIVARLTAAARTMTTLRFDHERLEAVGERFATVAGLRADPSFPDSVRIEVAERRPALVVRSGGQRVAVAGDGVVLTGIEPPGGLPAISLDRLPDGSLDGKQLALARVAGAAPKPLLPLIEHLRDDGDDGITFELGGIEVRFGGPQRAADKWAAAAAVLADPELAGATYVDVQVPEQAAVGGAVPAA